MTTSNRAKAVAAASALAGLALAAAATTALAQPTPMPAGMERCYGVARAGHNDCAAGAHSCAAQATRDNDPASFVYLPTGACMKLAHGSTTAGR